MGDMTFVAEPGRQDITITRLFDFPPERVFMAMTDPELIPQWWGPRKYTTKVHKMRFKVGGQWRFINIDAQGKKYGFHGVYHLI
jgi:uncharacterized protein YndB with AHSA1/START domain